jgi:hypothetical protein
MGSRSPQRHPRRHRRSVRPPRRWLGVVDTSHRNPSSPTWGQRASGSNYCCLTLSSVRLVTPSSQASVLDWQIAVDGCGRATTPRGSSVVRREIAPTASRRRDSVEDRPRVTPSCGRPSEASRRHAHRRRPTTPGPARLSDEPTVRMSCSGAASVAERGIDGRPSIPWMPATGQDVDLASRGACRRRDRAHNSPGARTDRPCRSRTRCPRSPLVLGSCRRGDRPARRRAPGPGHHQSAR